MSPILAFALAAAATQPYVAPAACRDRLRPAKGVAQPGIRKLGDEPNAAAIRPVLRVDNGCPTPVLVRGDIGGQRRGGR